MDNFVYSSGGAFVDDLLNPTKLLYSDPRVVKADPAHAGPDGQVQRLPVGHRAGLVRGRLARAVRAGEDRDVCQRHLGSASVPHRGQSGFDWDIAPFPAGPTGLHGVQTGWSGYGIGATSKHKQEAWELVKYLAGPVGLSNLAKSGLAQPALARLANSPLWLDNERPRNRKLTIEEVPYIRFEVLSPKWTEDQRDHHPQAATGLERHADGGARPSRSFCRRHRPKLDELNHPPYHPKLNWGAGGGRDGPDHAAAGRLGVAGRAERHAGGSEGRVARGGAGGLRCSSRPG